MAVPHRGEVHVQDHWRIPARTRRVALELVDEPAAAGRAAEQTDARRRLARVYHHLAAIAPKKRLAFILHVIDGRSIEEVAEVMYATVFATRSRVLWGRRALIGADDYITKPFSIEELILKIEVFLRRSKGVVSSAPALYRIGQYEFHPHNLSLERAGESRRLTQRESDLLLMLIQQKGQVVKRSLILEKLWGQDDYFLGRSLDVFISRLRRYLGADPAIKLETVHGVGFHLLTDSTN